MKKTLLLAVAMLLTASTMDAQSRKTWDFRNGMSDATKLDLNTDTQLWGANRTTDDGEVYGWKNVATLSSTFIANGNVIKEFEGLSFGCTLSANSILRLQKWSKSVQTIAVLLKGKRTFIAE